jgi:hypothetical protein
MIPFPECLALKKIEILTELRDPASIATRRQTFGQITGSQSFLYQNDTRKTDGPLADEPSNHEAVDVSSSSIPLQTTEPTPSLKIPPPENAYLHAQPAYYPPGSLVSILLQHEQDTSRRSGNSFTATKEDQHTKSDSIRKRRLGGSPKGKVRD